ncbi:GNAT family N-acetyltransferase [Streptomyces sp. NPDC052101]|uniref:GNAT family N-acetyltransferase n=1 Tax=Streptomyces sp. NPDC052101 TaxID=3155763 RepID=UPI00343E88BA
MRLHWDWIHPVLPVPYVPTLGPVHPDAPLPALFEAVCQVSGTGAFLPYDKDQRWGAVKAEQILTGDIEHAETQTLVPTLTERGAVRTVKVHVFGQQPDSLSAGADLAVKLATVHAARARIVWLLGPEQPETYAQDTGTRVQLKTFTPGMEEADPGTDVRPWGERDAHSRESFGAFAEEMKADGFAFLYEQMRTGVGPVLTITDGARIVGAIGPMDTMADADGRTQLLPQYFGVLTETRGRGYGRALWRAAMHWGREHGAAYQLLQTEVGGASDRLCTAEGLTSLGFVCTRTVA